jgi:hypothetical protein
MPPSSPLLPSRFSSGIDAWQSAIHRRRRVPRGVFLLGLMASACCVHAHAESLTADRLGVIYNKDSASSARVAEEYARLRGVSHDNLIGLSVPDRDGIDRDELRRLRASMLEKLPSNVQSLLLVWSRPYAVECMSITTAMAAGFRYSRVAAGRHGRLVAGHVAAERR